MVVPRAANRFFFSEIKPRSVCKRPREELGAWARISRRESMPRRAAPPTDNSGAEARVARCGFKETRLERISSHRDLTVACVLFRPVRHLILRITATQRNLLNAAVRNELSKKPAWPILCSPAVLLRTLKIPHSCKYVHISEFYRTPSFSNVAISMEVASVRYLNTLPR